jgi:hypothetical protein
MILLFESLYLMSAAILGYCLIQQALPKHSTATRVGLGISIGLSAYFAIDLAIGLFPFPEGPIVALLLKLVCLTGMVSYALRVRALPITGLVLVCAIPVVLAIAQSFLGIAVLSFDSYNYLALSQSHYAGGFDLFHDIQRGLYSSYSAGVWVSHANSGLWGADFLALFHPLVLIATLFIALGGVQDLTPDASAISTAIIGTAITLFALSAPQFVHHATYIIPNSFGGLLVITLIVMVLAGPTVEGTRAQHSYWVVLAAVSLAMAFSRLESSLFMVLILALLAGRQSTKDRTDFGIAAVFVVSIMSFQLFAHLVGRSSGPSILTVNFSLALISIALVAFIGLVLVRRTVFRVLVPHLPALTVLAIFLVVAVLTVFRGEHAEMSNRFFVLNTFGHAGIWFNTWLIIGLAALFYAGVNRDLDFNSRFLVATLIAGVLLVIGLGILRDPPYRLGAQDSGNRMLLQFFPIALIILGLSLHRFWSEATALFKARRANGA